MKNNSPIINESSHSSSVLSWSIITGGVIGLFVGFLHRANILIIPGFSTIFSVIPFSEILTGTLLGIIIGGFIAGFALLYSSKNPEVNPNSSVNTSSEKKNVTVQIKEEQLEVAKRWIQTGDVRVYRKSVTEEKNFIVPITREELIIEKLTPSSDTLDNNPVPAETMHIVLSEEQVEFTKRKVHLEDVSVYKQYIQEIKHIEETLKKEKVKINVSGSPKIKDKSKLLFHK